MNKEFKVKDIFQPQQVSEKLRKQEVLFTWNDGRWDHDVVIQFLNDRIDSLVQLNIGRSLLHVVYRLERQDRGEEPRLPARPGAVHSSETGVQPATFCPPTPTGSTATGCE